MTKKLTPKEKAFVDNYIANGGNETQAAIEARYSEKTAKQTGYENLTKPYIKEALEEIRKDLRKIAELQGITPEAILRQYALIASSSVLDIMTWNESGVSLLNSDDLTPEQAATIQEVSQTENQAGCSMRIKQYSKLAALDKLSHILGLDREVLTIEHVISDPKAEIDKLVEQGKRQRITKKDK